MQDPPPPPESAPPPPRTPEVREHEIFETARQLYRRSVSLKIRLAIDTHLRRLLGLAERSDGSDDSPRKLARSLESLLASGGNRTKVTTPSKLPAIVTFNAVPWESAVQRPHHFARGLGKKGHAVLWVDTNLIPPERWRANRRCPQVAPGVFLVRLPSSSRDIYQHVPYTEAALDAMTAAVVLTAVTLGFHEVVSLVDYPRWQPLAMRLRDRAGWKVVYDCLDDQVAMSEIYQPWPGICEEQLRICEERLVEGADLIFTSSIVLQERMQRRSPILLQNAANFELFSSAMPMGHLRNLTRPVIGYFGALADWLDFNLIRAAALELPNWSFVYIGFPVFKSAESEARWFQSTDLPNITLIPQVDPRTLAAHLAEFDVCIMPFLDLPVTRTANPVKLYEYLAAGKPVVARNLPEVQHLLSAGADLIAVYSTPEEFFDCLRNAVAVNELEQVSRRQTFARENDWSKRVDMLSAKMADLFQDINSINASSKGSKTRSHE